MVAYASAAVVCVPLAALLCVLGIWATYSGLTRVAVALFVGALCCIGLLAVLAPLWLRPRDDHGAEWRAL